MSLPDASHPLMSPANLPALFAHSPLAVLLVDPDEHIVYANPACGQLLGCEPGELAGRALSTLLIGSLAEGAAFTHEAGWALPGTGPAIGVEVSSTTIGQAPEPTLRLIQLRAAENEGQLPQGATHAFFDHLTGLPSRQLFHDRLKQSIRHARRHKWRVAVMFLDVDQFDFINQSLGLDWGDSLLVAIADRLRKVVRSYDTVARFGADQFLLILNDIQEAWGIERAAERVLEALEAPFVLAGHEMPITVRLGVSHFPTHADDDRLLVQYAQQAQRIAKAQLQRFHLYDPEEGVEQQASPRALEIKKHLHKAVERNELLLHYQPKVCLKTGAVVGAEALVRWFNPELGFVPPLQFIPLAEESGLIAPITDWVLRQASEQVAAWRDAGLKIVPVSVNLSARNFLQKELDTQVCAIIEGAGLTNHDIELEITENALLQNVQRTSEMLKGLDERGFYIALDDFGTGYSSLSYLQRYPLHILKIDRSFVRDLATAPQSAAIVEGIIKLAESLKLNVVAEGAEDLATIRALKAMGCPQVQGYYFSKPLPADEFAALLAKDAPFKHLL